MRPKTFFTVIFIMVVISCKCQEAKHIYLNAEQLKPLGIELSEKGLFYQNCNPKWQEDGKYPYYYFYSVDENHYVTSGISNNCTQNTIPMNEHDTILLNKKITEHDFYPLFAGSDGKYTFLSDKPDKELLPIAIRMKETKIPNRTDTVIFWFKVTDSLKKALPKGIVIEDYLGFPDVKE